MLTSLSRHLIHGTTVLSLSLILTACGGSSGGGTPTPSSSAPTAQSASAGQTSSDPGSSVQASSVQVSSSEQASSQQPSSEQASSVQSSNASSAEPVASAPASSAGISSESNSSEAASSSVQATEVSPFSFEAETGAALSALVVSNEVELEIVAGPVDISIDKGEYSLNGGSTFTADAGTVDQGDTVIVQIKASETFSTDTSATLTVGGVSGTFTVTSEAEDTTPDNFSFTPQDDLAPGAEVLSNTVTIDGINTPVAITIENGLYRINDAEAFTADEGMVEKGDKLTVKTDMPDSANADKEVTVKVGTFTAPFLLSTVEDNEPAEAAFVFPPPMTATEGDSVIVRGTAKDELSAVVRVTLTVKSESGSETYEVDTEDDFATWQKSVTLVPGENLISVIAEDEHGHVMEEATSVTVVKQAFANSFPEGQEELVRPRDLVFDEERNRILVSGGGIDGKLVSVDLNTGERSIFLESLEGFSLISPKGLFVDTKEQRLLVTGEVNQFFSVFSVDLDTKEWTVLSSSEYPEGEQPTFSSPSAITLDPLNPERALVLEQSISDSLQVLDLNTGLRTIVSSNDMEGPPFEDATEILVDVKNNRAFVDQGTRNILVVDLEDGKREIFMAEGVPEGTPRIGTSTLLSDEDEGRILIFERFSRALWAVDIETKSFTVISGSDTPYQHNPLGGIVGMDWAPSMEYVVGIDWDVNTIYVIDIATGERLILSKPEIAFPI